MIISFKMIKEWVKQKITLHDKGMKGGGGKKGIFCHKGGLNKSVVCYQWGYPVWFYLYSSRIYIAPIYKPNNRKTNQLSILFQYSEVDCNDKGTKQSSTLLHDPEPSIHPLSPLVWLAFLQSLIQHQDHLGQKLGGRLCWGSICWDCSSVFSLDHVTESWWLQLAEKQVAFCQGGQHGSMAGQQGSQQEGCQEHPARGEEGRGVGRASQYRGYIETLAKTDQYRRFMLVCSTFILKSCLKETLKKTKKYM